MGKRTKVPLLQHKSLFWFKDFPNWWPSNTTPPSNPSTRPVGSPTQEDAAEDETNWKCFFGDKTRGHDSLKDVAPANHEKELKKNPLAY